MTDLTDGDGDVTDSYGYDVFGGRPCGQPLIPGRRRCAGHLASLRSARAEGYRRREDEATPIGRAIIGRALELGIMLTEAADRIGVIRHTIYRLVWKGSRKTWQPHIRDGLASFLDREMGEVESLLWRSRPPRAIQVHGTPDALRRWLLDDRERSGFPSWAAYAQACAVPKGRLTNFLSERVALLSLDTLKAIAAARDLRMEYLVQLQGPLTAENLHRETARQNIAAWNSRHPAGDTVRKETIRPALQARAAHPRQWQDKRRQTISKGALERLAANEEAPLWKRWIAGRMLDIDMNRPQLATALGVTPKRVKDLLVPSNRKPLRDVTICSLEAVLGPMSADALQEIRAGRSASGAGQRMRDEYRKTRRRAEKWTGAMLVRRVRDLGPDVPQDFIEQARKLPPDRRIHAEGAKHYISAQMAAKRARIRNPATAPRSASTGPRGSLRLVLRGLREGAEDRVFQREGCGHLWHRKSGGRTHPLLCNPCWRKYSPLLANWKRCHAEEPQPRPRKHRGRNLSPDQVRTRLVSLLEYRLASPPEVPTEDERKVLQDMERRVRESKQPWFQEMTRRLDSLTNRPHLPL